MHSVMPANWMWRGLLAVILMAASAATANAQPAGPAPGSSSDEDRSLARPLPEGGVEEDVEEAYRRAVELWQEESTSYEEIVGNIVNSEYRSRRARIDSFFQAEIDSLRVVERERRNDAIAQFEAFLERYPDHPRHSPDVLFRLAELTYERAEDDYLREDLYYAEAQRRYDLGLIPELPEAPEKDFEYTISLFERLIEDFPEYRQLDGAYYLLGFCQLEMDRLSAAQRSFEDLVVEFPDSQFAQEAFLRIGEEFFRRNNFRMARPAYERALLYGDSIWYDKIVFKLGWSNYLLNEYDEAIANFEALLDYYKERGTSSAQAVREETIEYYAITLAEQDWDLDGQTDDAFIMGRVNEYLDEEEPYTQEVLDELSRLLAEYAEGSAAAFYGESQIEVLNHTLERYPLDPGNARRHNEIISALFRMEQVEEALAEGRRFSEIYGDGSDWYAEQERQGNFTQIAFAERVSRELLIEAGGQMYNEAQQLAFRAASEGDEELADQARQRFGVAARIYEEFLTTYPNDIDAYDVRMFRAQALLNAGQYQEAAEQFVQVRDSQLSREYYQAASALTIQSYAEALRNAINNGELEARAYPPMNTSAAVDEEVAAEEGEEDEEESEVREAPSRDAIPELSRQWADAIDYYVRNGLNSEEEPDTQGRYAFSAAKLYYDYANYDEAATRFQYIIDTYCGQEETGFAAALLIESYRIRQDFEQVEFWANEVERRGECVQVPEELMAAFQADLERFRMGAVADQAEELYAAGRFEEAAREYIRLTEDYADSDFAPLGLYNAGIIYEQDLQDFRRAMEQFERLIEIYPESEHVEDAMVRIAVNSKQFFDFDKAIATYLELHDRGYSNPEGVQFPLLDAAELLQYTQQYERAIDAYREFVRNNPDDGHSPAALYTVAQLYDRLGQDDEMLDAYARYRREYGDVTNEFINGDVAVIESIIRELELAREDGRRNEIERLEQELLTQYEQRQPDNANIRYAVAEIYFNRAVEQFEEWDSIELGEDPEVQRERIAQRRDGIAPVREVFNEVVVIGSADMTACAVYYRGLVYKTMADRIVRMPAPDFSFIRDEDVRYEAEDIYYAGSDDGSWPGVNAIVRQYEDLALEEWESEAYPLMQRLGVVNRCTRATVEELNRIRPEEYPVFREEIRETEDAYFTPSSVAMPPEREEQGGAALEARPEEEE